MSFAVPSSYRAAVVSAPNEKFVFRDIPTRELKPNEVLVRVRACGLCHSDCLTVLGFFPGVKYPAIPGHEVAGEVARVGSAVTLFKQGDRVGRGWHGGHCFTCTPCRRGDFALCANYTVTGIHTEGGYQEFMVAPWESLAFLPAELSFEEAAPLLCAGLTVFNGLRRTKALAPALVAVHGIGGLGHLAIQYAAKLGFQVAAISSGAEKEELAKKLGAKLYLDASKVDVVKELKQRGGARIIVATVYNADKTSELVPALSHDGVLLVMGVDPKPLSVPSSVIIGSRSTVQGWHSGEAFEAEQTLQFSAEKDVRPQLEVFPFSKVQEAYDRMMSGKAKFRVVIVPEHK